MEFSKVEHLSIDSFISNFFKFNNMQAKPLHTELIRSGNRSFFFDIKQSEKGNAYLTINITQKQEDGTYNRDKITVFEREMVKFGEGMMRAMINFRQTGREAGTKTESKLELKN